MDDRCYECSRTRDDTLLRKCPTCHRYFCEEHSSVMSGRPFCSRGCAHTFFFSGEDDS